MMMSKVSVIMTVYNEFGYLKESVQSILDQTYENWELLIVVDNNDEEIRSLIKDYTEDLDPRITVFYNEANIGLTKSLNFAIGNCTGKYIARLDADDLSSPLRLERQVQLLDGDDSIGMVGSAAVLIEASGNKIGQLKVTEKDTSIKRRLLFSNQFIHSSIMIRKKVLELYGVYNERMQRSQDYELWLRLRNKITFCNISDPLISYRKHANSITRKNNIEQRLNGLRMMHFYVKDNMRSFTISEKMISFSFFCKQFFKILQVTYFG